MNTESREIDKTVIGWFAVIHVIAIVGPFFYTDLSAIIAALVMYAISVLGISVGYHRLLAHRSFKAPRFIERTFATMGLLAMQRSPVEWVGQHRMHHSHVDSNKDPHDATKGFWWSHLFWMCVFRPTINDRNKLERFARDVNADPYLRFLTPGWVQAGAQILLGAIFLLVGGWSWVIWGIFVRLVVVYHVTWLVNSACHMYGYRNYNSPDISTNFWPVGFLGFGEGWHNNHHAQQNAAAFGHKWWEFDVAWQVVKLLRVFRLATNVNQPEN